MFIIIIIIISSSSSSSKIGVLKLSLFWELGLL
jgi:hypothetical protein